MLAHRASRVAVATSAVLLALLALQEPPTALAALSDKSVCTFETGKLYVRDASQTAFPPGFLSCVGADGKAIARCAECKCRDKQSGTTSGLQVEWGLCIEGTEGCVTAQTPEREFCGNATESGAVFVPGKVTGAKTDGGKAPKGQESGSVQELASNTQITNGSEQKSSSSAFIVGGCAIAGVAAIAMFAVARKRQDEDRELGTPVQDLGPAYDHNKTAKAKDMSASTIQYKNRLSERMSGESILDDDDDSFRRPQGVPVPVPTSGRSYNNQPKAQPQYQQPQLPSFAPKGQRAPPSPKRESSFMMSDDGDDDRFTFDDEGFGSVSMSSDIDSFAYAAGAGKKTVDAKYTAGNDKTRPMEYDDSQRSNDWEDDTMRTMDFDDSERSKGWDQQHTARTTVDFDDSSRTVDFSASGMSEFSVDFGASSTSVDFGASSTSVDFGASMASVDSRATAVSDTSTTYGARVTSLSMESSATSMGQRDTDASEFLRASEDSVLFTARSTTLSNLAFFEEEARSPRKSVEF